MYIPIYIIGAAVIVFLLIILDYAMDRKVRHDLIQEKKQMEIEVEYLRMDNAELRALLEAEKHSNPTRAMAAMGQALIEIGIGRNDKRGDADDEETWSNDKRRGGQADRTLLGCEWDGDQGQGRHRRKPDSVL